MNKKESHQLINQDSGDVEYYTPAYIVETAREVMGSIDIDPASSMIANQTIKATIFYTKEDNGLLHPWYGNGWLNHPFSKGEEVCIEQKCKKKTCQKRGYHCTERVPSNAEWIDYLISEYLNRHLKQFCQICYASVSEKWFRPLHVFPRCEFYGRVNYLDEKGNEVLGATKASCLHYGGSNVEKFADLFSPLGAIKIPWSRKS